MPYRYEREPMTDRRILDAFRQQYRQNRADLEAFDAAYRAETFTGPDDVYRWAHAWWEARLQGRALDTGTRRLRGQQRRT